MNHGYTRHQITSADHYGEITCGCGTPKHRRERRCNICAALDGDIDRRIRRIPDRELHASLRGTDHYMLMVRFADGCDRQWKNYSGPHTIAEAHRWLTDPAATIAVRNFYALHTEYVPQ